MKYRLRIKNQICGYQKLMNNTAFYSKDMYGWSSSPIEHFEKDLCLELKDKKGNMLFHGDICLDTINNEIIIIYQINNIWLKINNLNYEHVKIEQSLSFTKVLKRFDYLYEYPEKEDILRKVIL
tara:strand:- start:241 stop:612 length:372 start_codon:yes stop_codon:yes gene_type:complete